MFASCLLFAGCRLRKLPRPLVARCHDATLFRAQRQFSRFAIGGICRVIRSHRNNSIRYATRANRLARGAYPYSFNLPDKVRKPMPSASAVLAR
jgi:hypothetical protein